MVNFKTGNLLEDQSDALVNSVNCVGIMGKGLALHFKLRYVPMFVEYQQVCADKALKPGMVWPWLTGELQPRVVFNVATKDHWRGDSKLAWVKQGLDELLKQVKEYKVKSVALPLLGCGLGGLDKVLVQQMTTYTASRLPSVEWNIYGAE